MEIKSKGGTNEMCSCIACGGTIRYVDSRIAKCDYCGKMFLISGENLSEANLEDIYREAVNLATRNGDNDAVTTAIDIFEALGTYKDSSKKAYECKNAIEREKIAEADRKLEQQRKKELAEIEQKKKEFQDKQKRKWISIVAVTIMVVLVIVIMVVTINNSRMQCMYDEAMLSYEKGEYELALDQFSGLGDYADSQEYVNSIKNLISERDNVYKKGIEYYENALYKEAVEMFSMFPGYLESDEYKAKSAEKLYEKAKSAFDNENYEVIQSIVAAIPETSNVHAKAVALLEETNNRIVEMQNANTYAQAIKAYDSGDYDTAQRLFIALGEYSESVRYKNEIANKLYKRAKEFYNVVDYISCIKQLESINEESEWNDYLLATELMGKAKGAYIENIEKNALTILKKEGYDAFERYVDNAANDVFLKEQAQSIKDEWKPTFLHTLDPMSSTVNLRYNSLEWESGFVDNVGETHNNVLVGGLGTHKYYVNGMFDKLSGIAVIRDEAMMTGRELSLKIYGEKQNLLYSLELSSGEKPVDFIIDVSNEKTITIEFIGSSKIGETRGIQYFGGLAELKLYSVP